MLYTTNKALTENLDAQSVIDRDIKKLNKEIMKEKNTLANTIKTLTDESNLKVEGFNKQIAIKNKELTKLKTQMQDFWSTMAKEMQKGHDPIDKSNANK